MLVKRIPPVEMRNVTLALSRSLLRKAKLLAAERDTSISGLLTGFLEEIVRRHGDYERARPKAIRDLRRPPDLATGGRASWKRDDLHRRS
jgi:hypothetical protein